MDELRRFELLGVKCPAKKYDIVYFEGLTYENAIALIDEGFLDENDSQNESPTAREFVDFMAKHKEITAHGYAVTPDRSDCRVTIGGLESNYAGNAEVTTVVDFVNLCKYADDLTITPTSLYCWYD